jgi:hypothetical protein
MATYRRRQLVAIRQALDEARFGSARTLNLRATLPSVREATARAESWLRQRQIDDAGEVLIITGRGKGSPDGVSPVREAVERLLSSLRRRGVVAEHREHTPGSFIVRLAPTSALWESPARRREPNRAPLPADPPSLMALEPETRDLLRALAIRSLESLGVRDTSSHLHDEMLKQFGALVAGIPSAVDRDVRLRAAIARAIDEYDAER